MICIVVPVVLLYYCSFLYYYRKLFPVQGRRVIQTLLPLMAIALAYIFIKPTDVRWIRLPILMFVMAFGIRFSTGADWLQSVYGGSCSVLSAYCFRGIFAVFSAFALRSINPNNMELYDAGTIISLPLTLILFVILYKTILPDDKLKLFLYNRNQLKYVVVYELTAVANLSVINSGRDLLTYDLLFTGRHLTSYGLWYVSVCLGAYTLTIGILIYAIYQSIKSTELLEYQWRTEMLEGQYERQVRHYKSYQKYTESFQIYKHDYKSMMASVKSLIWANENEKALQLIDDMFDDMQKRVLIHKKYSDNIILDAMLQDLANICSESEIRFSSSVCAPRDTGLSTIDAIRIFSNFANNAVEACLNVPVSERFIEVATTSEQQWVTLQAINSYDGKSRVENGKLISTKPDNHNHGLGLRIVAQIAENLGGFMMYEADPQTKIFLVRIHIPRLCKDQSL